jgi:hypothetical protein
MQASVLRTQDSTASKLNWQLLQGSHHLSLQHSSVDDFACPDTLLLSSVHCNALAQAQQRMTEAVAFQQLFPLLPAHQTLLISCCLHWQCHLATK